LAVITRFELLVGIAHVDDDVICDDILNGLSVEANLIYCPVKRLAGKSIDRKIDLTRLVDRADVGLVDVGDDLHLSQIVGDSKQDRRRETGRNGLADIDLPRNNHAVNRRSDRGVRKD